jgi:hypothetical protein
MDQGPEIQEYSAGDQVRMRLTVVHEQSLDLGRVAAAFEREGRKQEAADGREAERIELTTRRGLQREELRLQPGGTPMETQSHGSLSGRVPPEAALGEYRLRSIEGDYGSGGRISFDLRELSALRFRVVEPPFAQPRVTELKFT